MLVEGEFLKGSKSWHLTNLLIITGCFDKNFPYFLIRSTFFSCSIDLLPNNYCNKSMLFQAFFHWAYRELIWGNNWQAERSAFWKPTSFHYFSIQIKCNQTTLTCIKKSYICLLIHALHETRLLSPFCLGGVYMLAQIREMKSAEYLGWLAWADANKALLIQWEWI